MLLKSMSEAKSLEIDLKGEFLNFSVGNVKKTFFGKFGSEYPEV